MVIDLYIQLAACVLAIPALAFLRRLQGRYLGTHSLHKILVKPVIKSAQAIVVAAMFWPHIEIGVVVGLLTGFVWLNIKHQFGTAEDPSPALKRYGHLCGEGYVWAAKEGYANWTNLGEYWLGGSTAACLIIPAILVSTIL